MPARKSSRREARPPAAPAGKRPYWSGQIRLALVSIAVNLYTATRSTSPVAFRQIARETGKPIKLQKVAPGIGPVEADDIAKGFEIERGRFVIVEPGELDQLRLESRKTLELVQFVPVDDIDLIYFDRPYYVVPADDLAEEAFVVLREALRRTGKAGLGQLAMRGREVIVCLRPCCDGMLAETLRYDEEVYRAAAYFEAIPDLKPDRELLDLAIDLIDRKTAAFDAGRFRDHYVEAVLDLIKAKAKTKGAVVDAGDPGPAAGGGNVIDLMAALKKSVEGTGQRPAKDSSRSTPRTGRKKA